jgi:hypothetical protein
VCDEVPLISETAERVGPSAVAWGIIGEAGFAYHFASGWRLGARTSPKNKVHSILGCDIPKTKHLSLHVKANATGGESKCIYNARIERSLFTGSSLSDFSDRRVLCSRICLRTCFFSPDDRTSVVGQLAPDVVTSRFGE